MQYLPQSGEKEEGREEGGRRSAYPHFYSGSTCMILTDRMAARPWHGLLCYIWDA